jgi:hypothetical protein
VFDRKKNGVIEYEEFMGGVALYCKGTLQEKLRMLFGNIVLSMNVNFYKRRNLLKSSVIPTP